MSAFEALDARRVQLAYTPLSGRVGSSCRALGLMKRKQKRLAASLRLHLARLVVQASQTTHKTQDSFWVDYMGPRGQNE